jgi:hypothetical protein
MRALAIGLTLAILGGPKSAQDRPADRPTAPTRVDVRLQVARSIKAPAIIEAVKREAERIWAPYAIQLVWVADVTTPDRRSIPVQLDREVGTGDESEWRAVLGNVVVGPKRDPADPIRISFDGTKSMLMRRIGPTRFAIPGIVPDCLLARALGRVLAHEIGHVLIGEPFHDRRGLMRANFSPDQLAEIDPAPFRLSCSTVDRIKKTVPIETGRVACD